MQLVSPRTSQFFGHFARAYPGRTALMIGLQVFSAMLEGISVIALVPLLEVASRSATGGSPSRVGQAVENGLGAVGLPTTLPVLIALIVAGITLKSIFLWLSMRQVGFTMSRVVLDLRLELVDALLRARWSFFGRHTLGAFANSITGEAFKASAAYREACVVIGSLLQLSIYVVISALISWQVTLVALLTGGLLMYGLRRLVSRGRQAGEQQTQRTSNLAARLVDALQGLKPMKAMSREAFLAPVLREEAEGINQAQRQVVMVAEAFRLFQEPVATLVLGIGLYLMLTVVGAQFSSILVLAFVFYRLMTSINTLQVRFHAVTVGESSYWALREKIDEAVRSEEHHPGTRVQQGLSGSIELRDVRFAYGELRVLDGLSISIPAGRLTALVGRSGSGKTTILDLITGLHRPESGEVYLDGVPLAEVSLESWRRLIGYVPQDTFLFHDTVRRNITLGDESIPDERVERALRDAGAWAFIVRDARGLAATIAPQASNLSGGQRQRLAIARALVKDPALIVLDEATTGLDAATEAGILETLAALRGRVTILAISHQPAIRESADLVLELEDGRVRSVTEGVAAAAT